MLGADLANKRLLDIISLPRQSAQRLLQGNNGIGVLSNGACRTAEFRVLLYRALLLEYIVVAK